MPSSAVDLQEHKCLCCTCKEQNGFVFYIPRSLFCSSLKQLTLRCVLSRPRKPYTYSRNIHLWLVLSRTKMVVFKYAVNTTKATKACVVRPEDVIRSLYCTSWAQHQRLVLYVLWQKKLGGPQEHSSLCCTSSRKQQRVLSVLKSTTACGVHPPYHKSGYCTWTENTMFCVQCFDTGLSEMGHWDNRYQWLNDGNTFLNSLTRPDIEKALYLAASVGSGVRVVCFYKFMTYFILTSFANELPKFINALLHD